MRRRSMEKHREAMLRSSRLYSRRLGCKRGKYNNIALVALYMHLCLSITIYGALGLRRIVMDRCPHYTTLELFEYTNRTNGIPRRSERKRGAPPKHNGFDDAPVKQDLDGPNAKKGCPRRGTPGLDFALLTPAYYSHGFVLRCRSPILMLTDFYYRACRLQVQRMLTLPDRIIVCLGGAGHARLVCLDLS